MSTIHDKTGLRFGRLVVLEPQGRAPSGNVRWLCQCDCGKTTIVVGNFLGRTRSCRCLRRDQLVTHGQSQTPTYRSWKKMHERCRNPKHKYYMNYGGRGIKVDDPRWDSFVPFRADMGDRPPGLTLDRIDNERGYSKINCRWATRKEQNANRRKS